MQDDGTLHGSVFVFLSPCYCCRYFVSKAVNSTTDARSGVFGILLLLDQHLACWTPRTFTVDMSTFAAYRSDLDICTGALG